MRNEGTLILIGVCCLWPLVVYVFIEFGIPRILAWSAKQFDTFIRIDWRNIRWSMLNPWSKHE